MASVGFEPGTSLSAVESATTGPKALLILPSTLSLSHSVLKLIILIILKHIYFDPELSYINHSCEFDLFFSSHDNSGNMALIHIGLIPTIVIIYALYWV